jgi:hypothetical protein
MNVQAREGVCHRKELYRSAKDNNINLKSFTNARSHRIGAHTDTDHIRLGGDGSLGWRCPRHFVPGYDRTVPPGHFATAFNLDAFEAF